jgi:hypothetical protein
MGRYYLFNFLIDCFFFTNLYIEQRVIREAIARDNQMHEIFADLDTNNDSL